MFKLLLLLSLVLATAGCNVGIDLTGGPKLAVAERPVVNLPVALRQPNWLGPQRQGSCVWATLTSLLRWQGRYHTADYLKQRYGDGEWAERFAERLNAEGIRFAQTTDGDMAFIDLACKTRRGCGAVIMGGRHMIAIVHASETEIGILDPNDVNRIHYVPRDSFETEFKNSGGWAFAVLYTPAPPLDGF